MRRSKISAPKGHSVQGNRIRRLCVSLLKREPSRMSLAMKRYRAAIVHGFLLKILAASASE